jgi:Spy/CpxP family protein refolding chaperone
MLDPRMTLLAVTLGGLSLLGAGAYTAHAHGGFRGFRHPEMAHKFLDLVVSEKLDEIGATPAQRQKVAEVKERLLKAGHALHESRGPLREEMLGLLAKDRLEASELKALVHARVEELTRVADEFAEGVAELHAVLTPEQRQTLLAEAREHMARRRH